MRKFPAWPWILAPLMLVSGCGNVSPAPPPPPATLSILPVSAPAGTVGFSYSLTLSASGGQSPYTWSLISGALPSGLSLNPSTGVLSGVPTASGTSNFTVQATDSSGPAVTGNMPLAIVVNPQLAFSITSLPDGAVGVPYNANASIVGGIAPCTWSIASGGLPPGLSLNSATGAITGTPTSAGGFGLGLQVTDSSAPPQTAKFFSGINVNPQMSITSSTLPDGAVGVSYSATLTATGGTDIYTWSISAGSLPDGIVLDPNTGILSGTPTSAGQASFTVEAADTANPPQTTTLPLSLNVAADSSNDGLLRGTYSFLLRGFDSNGAVAVAGSIDADGAGRIAAGVFDANRSTGSEENVRIESGSFAIGSDHRGTVTIHSARGDQTFRVAMNAAGTLAHFIVLDAADPAAVRGNGVMERRDPATPSSLVWDGSYAFSFSGATPSGHRSAMLGSFSAKESGAIPEGIADANSGGLVVPAAVIDGSSSYAPETNSRGKLRLVVSGLGTIEGAIYSVSQGESFFVRLDAPGSDVLSGEIERQAGEPASESPFAGASILRLQGESDAGSSVVAMGRVVSDGASTLTGTYDSNDGGRVNSIPLAHGSYEITSAIRGRGTIEFAGNDLVFYSVDPSKAFVMDTMGRGARTGQLDKQSTEVPALRFPVGTFSEGSEGNTGTSVELESGVLTIESSGRLSAIKDVSPAGNTPSSARTLRATLSARQDGRITAPNGLLLYVISPTRFVETEMNEGQANPEIAAADQ